MNSNKTCDTDKISFFEDEFKNLQEITAQLKPLSGEIPELKGIDIYGEVIPLDGVSGGDHIIFVDFNRRYDLDSRIEEAKKEKRFEVAKNLKLNKRRAGILIADVSGHQITDAILAAMLHQAFLIGVLYELQQYGQITMDLFENINTRFFNSSSLKKYITLIYGEISDTGNFRFLNAGHPHPYIFSNKFDQLVKIYFQRVVNVQPIGTLPSKEDIDVKRNFSNLGLKRRYSVNEINLMGAGDILLLYTDGLSEHNLDMKSFYFPKKLEETLKKKKKGSAKEIFFNIKEDLMKFADPSDDISIVVIKKVS